MPQYADDRYGTQQPGRLKRLKRLRVSLAA